MLCAVRDLAPELVTFVHSTYSESSSLFWGVHCLQSSEGVQQGDPLGPFCFALPSTSSPHSCSLNCASSIWMMEPWVESEIISADPMASKVLLALLPNLQVTDPASATQLGSPISNIDGISSSIHEKSESLKTLGDRIHYLHTQDALLLLHHSLAIPKLLYTLRTAPVSFPRSSRSMTFC